jgi:hypothetical protein
LGPKGPVVRPRHIGTGKTPFQLLLYSSLAKGARLNTTANGNITLRCGGQTMGTLDHTTLVSSLENMYSLKAHHASYVSQAVELYVKYNPQQRTSKSTCLQLYHMALDWTNWAVFSKNIVNSYQLKINYPQQLGMWQVFGRREIDRNLVRTAEEKISLGRSKH